MFVINHFNVQTDGHTVIRRRAAFKKEIAFTSYRTTKIN